MASVPVGHVYVRHLAPEGEPGVLRLPDPDPGMPCTPDGAPRCRPVMLDPEWARTARFDLFHLHFGFRCCTTGQLEEFLDVLQRRGKPLVFTVHDLRDRHQESSELLSRQLDVLVPRADALITLTEGAAAEIRKRWDREALVLPHPHVVRLATMALMAEGRARRSPSGPYRIGLHVKSLRANMDPMRVLPTLVETVQDLPDTVLQVNAHRDVFADDAEPRAQELAGYLRELAAARAADVRVHDYLSDRAFVDYLDGLDVSVLPYRFGSHSGWLEACRDVDTTVIAPSCGFYAEQGPVLTYVHDGETFDASSLADAVRAAHRARPSYAASVAERRRQRADIAAAHEELYHRLVEAD
ncbi:glycosyltransferase family 4 protein [Nocardioides sp. BGMRC 2183]|nr:glycosyltransferase family 4 protein [Nocardioides sp. BGMRC 2183]